MKKPFTLWAISNGLGAQSMWLTVLAARKKIPCTVSITGDTGAELDRVWSTGERTTAREYFDRIVVPYCTSHGIEPRFVRAVDKNKHGLPDLITHLEQVIAAGKIKSAKIPLFGSEGGRLKQVCTEKYKIRAIHQEARRMGATQLVTAQGIHFGEADRRVRGRFIGDRDGWSFYQDVVRKNGIERLVKWCSHFYPLVDLRLRREQIWPLLDAEGLPYLISSECDHCPHKDLARWDRTSPDVLVHIAALEAKMDGKFFFTDERIPLMEALEKKRERGETKQGEIDFGCENGHCGI